jgi:hypothetical protein
MALTNRERIGKALDLTRDGLRGPIESGLSSHLGPDWARQVAGPAPKHPNPNDLSLLLSGILAPAIWADLWSRKLSPSHRSFVFEVRDARNRWAHQESISSDDAYRALDSMERVLELFGAGKQCAEVRALRVELQRQVFDAERRTQQRRTDRRTGGIPEAGLSPWREVITPHDDVAENRFEEAEFAADLHAVYEGGADAQYLDPRTFFTRTYLTQGLRGLITGAAERLSGRGGDPVVELQTNFGGGKTHSLIALYHLASGIPAAELPGVGELLAEEGLGIPAEISRAVLVGTQIQAGEAKEVAPDIKLHTLWGHMAWQLGGREGYEIVRRADETGTNPGESLAQLFQMCSPALILIDEWVAYARELRDGGEGDRLPGGDFDTQFTFAQALTENVERSQGVVALVSVPSSTLEVGGSQGQLALERLHNVVARKASQWQPAQADESFEIVRRRLFDELPAGSAPSRDVVIDAYLRMYRQNREHFPPETGEQAYRERMLSTYPVHPALFDHLFGQWSALDKFQRTRGVLRLMALAIAELWSSGDKSLMIMPGNLPIFASAFSSELKKYLEEGWDPVIRSDVDGANSEPKRLDDEHKHFGRYAAARRVARTVYMGSAPGMAGNQRIDVGQVALGSVQPGEPPAQFRDALSQLARRSNHLYADGGQYWYSLQPNVTRMANDRAASNFSDADADLLVRREISGQRERGPFAGLHPFASGPGDVDDRDDGVRLVILDPEYAHSSNDLGSDAVRLAEKILGQRSAGPRLNRNLLVFVAADSERLLELRQSARLLLAWRSIVEDAERLDLTAHQLAQARDRSADSDTHVQSLISQTFRHLLSPVQRPGSPDIEWQVSLLRSEGPIAASAVARLASDERLIEKFSARRIRMDLDDHCLWGEQQRVELKSLWEAYCRFPYLARLASQEVLLKAAGEVAGMLVDDGLFGLEPNESIGLRSFLVHPSQIVKEFDGNGDSPPPPPPKPVPSHPTRFYGSFELDPIRANAQFPEIIDSIVAHLGDDVSIHLDVTGHEKGGYGDAARRTIAENASQLGGRQVEFSD